MFAGMFGEIKMKYVYFVSYFSNSGNGRLEITTTIKIETIKDIEQIEAAIAEDKEDNFRCAVHNFILLRTEDDEVKK